VRVGALLILMNTHALAVVRFRIEGNHRLKNLQSVVSEQRGFDRVFRMRISPNTLKRSLATPAIDRIEPLGFAASVVAPASSHSADHLPALFHLQEFGFRARRSIPRHA